MTNEEASQPSVSQSAAGSQQCLGCTYTQPAHCVTMKASGAVVGQDAVVGKEEWKAWRRLLYIHDRQVMLLQDIPSILEAD